MSEAWERQPGESTKAYNAFCAYRDLGPERSLEKAGRTLDKPRTKQYLGEWSVKYNWVKRSAAYDDYIEKEKRAKREAEIQKMVKKHARIATKLQKKALDRLKKLDPSKLTPYAMLSFLTEAIRIERLSLGEMDKIKLEHEGNINIPLKVQNDSIEQILSDPVALELAFQLRERIRMGQNEPVGAGGAGESGEMDPGTTS